MTILSAYRIYQDFSKSLALACLTPYRRFIETSGVDQKNGMGVIAGWKRYEMLTNDAG